MSTPRPPVTCHILDTTTGCPASNVICSIYKIDMKENEDTMDTTSVEPFALARTNEDGRVPSWVFNPDPTKRAELEALGISKAGSTLRWDVLCPGVYKVRFQTGKYFARQDKKCFFPIVDIIFEVSDTRHYHIPLLLSNYGYTTYRGS
ncbi:LAFE_0H10572g1_1 [Lachancea fermentati]|uniref:5-hydroxyisourate hydrolase n=1 Tax=Lachancea fermentati TaxID=4955 RepID=A0A1G4MKA6_LACFM|nr:LAFE_0H10572g1_1 [Lachancea fermentati]